MWGGRGRRGKVSVSYVSNNAHIGRVRDAHPESPRMMTCVLARGKELDSLWVRNKKVTRAEVE